MLHGVKDEENIIRMSANSYKYTNSKVVFNAMTTCSVVEEPYPIQAFCLD
jgi:hypothetical protein